MLIYSSLFVLCFYYLIPGQKAIVCYIFQTDAPEREERLAGCRQAVKHKLHAFLSESEKYYRAPWFLCVPFIIRVALVVIADYA